MSGFGSIWRYLGRRHHPPMLPRTPTGASAAIRHRHAPSSIVAGILALAIQAAVTACADDPPTTPRKSGPPRPPGMVIMSGNDQTGEVGTALPLPLVVRVTDSLGAPVARVMVRFLSSAT